MKVTATDKWFSLCVRERACWKCERCGIQFVYPTTSKGLDCSHYETRDNWAVRFWPFNCFALCRGCHEYFDKDRRFEYEVLFVDKMGQAKLDQVRRLALRSADLAKEVRHSAREMSGHYREQYRRMLVVRSRGRLSRVEFAPWPGYKLYAKEAE